MAPLVRTGGSRHTGLAALPHHNIQKEIYIEFVDIAETILSLIQEREWTRKTFALGSERDKKEQNIEKDIKKLKKDVDLTIEELTM